jgi:GTP cyclohydrolase I
MITNPLTVHRFEAGIKDPMLCKHCNLSQHDIVHPLQQPFEYTPINKLIEPSDEKGRRYLIEEGARLILQGLGVDLTDHNFATTPKRVADVYEEMFNPPETGWPVFDEEYTDIVIVKGHTFYTMCPHHMLPVEIRASVAYFPDGKVIGASKLCRLIHEVNRKPLTQEKLTDLICKAIKDYTQGTSKGEAVLLQGEHDCFKIRGIKSSASMVTYKFNGCFHEPENQRRFLELVKL